MALLSIRVPARVGCDHAHAGQDGPFEPRRHLIRTRRTEGLS